MTGPLGPEHVTTDIGSPDMAKRRIGAVTAGSGQATSPTGPVALARGTVFHRVVPAHLACRIGARAQAGERDAWLAVVSIALGSFALVFSELIPGSDRYRGKQRRTNPLKVPSAAMPGPLPGRKCHA